MTSSLLLHALRPIRFWPNALKNTLLTQLRTAAREAESEASLPHKGKARHSRIRCLAFIGHVLGSTNEDVSLRDYLVEFQGNTINITDDNIQEWIQSTAFKIVQHLRARPPPLHLFSHKLISWNVTSLLDLDSPGNKKKIRLIKMHLEKGPVFLQETKWNSIQAGLLAQCLGTVQVLSSPGIPSEDGNLSGGWPFFCQPICPGLRSKRLKLCQVIYFKLRLGKGASTARTSLFTSTPTDS
jgi:hypothetical protein